jgi:hypothetical protein
MESMRVILWLIPSVSSPACVSTELDVRTNHPAHPQAQTTRVPLSSALSPDFDVHGDSEVDAGAPAPGPHAGHGHAGHAPATQGASSSEKDPSKTVYTCPMHEEIRRNEPGTCPICGMKLVPAKEKQ